MVNNKVIECSNALASRKLTIGFAESATAGRLCCEFAMAPGAGNVFKGGLVCYDANLKETILGVSGTLIERFSAESAEVTREMAVKLKNVINSDVQVAVTGLTAPGGSESVEKPVGTMFIHIIIEGRSFCKKLFFSGIPSYIISETVNGVATFLLDIIAPEP